MDAGLQAILYLGGVGLVLGLAAVIWSTWADAREREADEGSSTPAE